MKKISNEIKVGAAALLTIIVFIWLYSFLKGKNILRKTDHYYVVYNNIGGLAESSPVEVSGYKVGIVQSIKFTDPESAKLLVTLAIDKSFKLPVNTIAEITTATLIAGMKIQFVYGRGPGYYEPGDTIPGRLAESLLTAIENELGPMKDKVVDLIAVLDSVINSVNDIMDEQFKKDLRSGVSSLGNTAANIDKVIGSGEKDLESAIKNISKFTAMLAENSEKMSSTFSSLEAIADTLSADDIYKSVQSLKASLESASDLIENLNNGKGSAGQLITNESLYVNLTASLKSLDLLLQDLKANPKRYVHFSVFGSKKVQAQ